MKRLIAFALGTILFAADEHSNRRAPGFSLPDSKMQQWDPADHRGKVVIVDFMKTECPHCQTASKALEKLRVKYGAKVQILSIVVPPDNIQSVGAYAAKHAVNSPILFDCGQVAGSYLKLGPKNPQLQLPHIFVIDPKGAIRHDYGWNAEIEKMIVSDGLAPIVDSLLAGK